MPCSPQIARETDKSRCMTLCSCRPALSLSLSLSRRARRETGAVDLGSRLTDRGARERDKEKLDYLHFIVLWTLLCLVCPSTGTVSLDHWAEI